MVCPGFFLLREQAPLGRKKIFLYKKAMKPHVTNLLVEENNHKKKEYISGQ